MRRILVAAAAAVLCFSSATAVADDTAAAKALAALEKRFETTDMQWMQAYEKFLPEYEAISKKYPGTEQDLTARLRVLTFAGRLRKDDAKMKAEAARLVDGILKDFPRSEQLAALTDQSFLFTGEKFAEVLEALSQPDQPGRVKAAVLLRRAKSKIGAKQAEDAKPLLEELVAKYAEVPRKYSTYGEIADALLNPHAASALAIGQPAPEILGKDLDGKPFKLSEFQGRVVVLDFFGDW